MKQDTIEKLQPLLASAQNILILTGQNPSLDSLGASLGLFLALGKMGKTVSVACPKAPTVEFGNLIGINKLKDALGNKNLVVSFPYTEGSIEKVSYNIEGDRFNLVIQTRNETRLLSQDKVKFSYQGVDADLIFIISTADLADLGSFYREEQALFANRPVVVIDHNPENKQYGVVNFFHPYASSTSEIVVWLLKSLGIGLDADIATNLLMGIDFATQGFASPLASTEAFEAAAACLRAGGKRSGVNKRAPIIEQHRQAKNIGIQNSSLPKINRTEDQKEEPTTPSDWFKPKVYKSSDFS
ncbi:DHH family phosphoesterase [Candidatus Microgenomates bacterium]|nr:DHH family phosphoesterase [Candidatus Microgenomates bacterium]